MTPQIPLSLRIAAWLAVAAWACTITYFSTLTGPEIAEFGITLWDKAEHFAAFTAGGVALSMALRWTFDWPWKKLARFAILALVVFGAIDEIHQLSTPNRSGADPFDWLADAFGALTGVSLFVGLYARYMRAHRPAPAGN